MAKYDAQYKDMSERYEVLNASCKDVMKDFGALHGHVIRDNVLNAKEKELIALGIGITIRCHDCILAHVQASKNAGATYEEIAEAVEVAIMMGGGPSTAYGSLALDIAKSLFE